LKIIINLKRDIPGARWELYFVTEGSHARGRRLRRPWSRPGDGNHVHGLQISAKAKRITTQRDVLLVMRIKLGIYAFFQGSCLK